MSVEPRPQGRLHRLHVGVLLMAMAGAVAAAAGAGVLIGVGHDDSAPGSLAHFESALPAAIPERGGAVVQNRVVSLHLPAGWSVQRTQDTDLQLRGPDGLVELFTQSGVDSATTLSSIIIGDLIDLERTHGQASVCEEPIDSRVVNNLNGQDYGLCYAETGVSVPAYAVEQLHQAALGADAVGGGQHILFQVVLTCERSRCDALVDQAAPLLRGIRWSQLPGR